MEWRNVYVFGNFIHAENLYTQETHIHIHNNNKTKKKEKGKKKNLSTEKALGIDSFTDALCPIFKEHYQ